MRRDQTNRKRTFKLYSKDEMEEFIAGKENVNEKIRKSETMQLIKFMAAFWVKVFQGSRCSDPAINIRSIVEAC